MHIVPRKELNELVDYLKQSVGAVTARGSVVHTAVTGVTATVDVDRVEYDANNPLQFCRLVRIKYVEALKTVIDSATEELAGIAMTGKSPGMLELARLLDHSFQEPDWTGEDDEA